MIDEGTKTWGLCSFLNHTVSKWQILFPNVNVPDSKSRPVLNLILSPMSYSVHYDRIQEQEYSTEYKAGFNLLKNALDE